VEKEVGHVFVFLSRIVGPVIPQKKVKIACGAYQLLSRYFYYQTHMTFSITKEICQENY